MKSSCSQRALAPDLIRCFAFFSVVSVHFFARSGYYDIVVDGTLMYLQTLLRSFFMVCVPLFIMLTGYLMRTRPLTLRYFTRITKTLGIYILASLACIAYRYLFPKDAVSLAGQLYGIFSFTTAPYSWYIEMYLGLFLLTPFLNILYNNLQTQRNKQLLLLVMFIMTALPSVFNIHRPELSWWSNPASDSTYYTFLPDWWFNIYPLTYYFIGCYLSEYPPKCKRLSNLLLLLASVILVGSFNYYRSHGATFIWGLWQDYGSAWVLLLSVLTFNLFLLGDYQNVPNGLRRILAKLSDWCLGAYLLSWIFDDIFYPMLIQWIPEFPQRILFFPVIVPAICLCSLVGSAVLNVINRPCQKVCDRI